MAANKPVIAFFVISNVPRYAPAAVNTMSTAHTSKDNPLTIFPILL